MSLKWCSLFCLAHGFSSRLPSTPLPPPLQKSTMVNVSMWNREKWYWWTCLQCRNKDADVKNGLVDTGRGKERLGRSERVALTYIRYHMQNSLLLGNYYIEQGAQLCALSRPRGVGWGEVGGSLNREGIYVYIELIHTAVQQKLTQHCQAMILQWNK